MKRRFLYLSRKKRCLDTERFSYTVIAQEKNASVFLLCPFFHTINDWPLNFVIIFKWLDGKIVVVVVVIVGFVCLAWDPALPRAALLFMLSNLCAPSVFIVTTIL